MLKQKLINKLHNLKLLKAMNEQLNEQDKMLSDMQSINDALAGKRKNAARPNYGRSIHNNKCISPCEPYSATGLYLRKQLGCAPSYCNVRRNGEIVSEKCIPESC